MKIKRALPLLLAGTLVISSFAGCKSDNGNVVAVLNGEEIQLEILNFMCKYEQAKNCDTYVGYFGEDVWTMDLYGNGETMGDTLKAEMVEELHELYTLKQHASDYDVELSDLDMEAIDNITTTFLADCSDGAKEEMNATEEVVTEVLSLYKLRVLMSSAIKESADVEVTDEEANMRGYSMISLPKNGSYDENYTYIELSDEEKQQVLDTADKIEAAVKDTADLEVIAEVNGVEVTKGTYDMGDTALDEEVRETLDSLNPGEVSGRIENDDIIYFVRLDTESDQAATETNKASLLEEKKTAYYNDTLAQWQEEDEWEVNEDVLEKIQFDCLFTAVKEEEDTASSEPETIPEDDTAQVLDVTGDIPVDSELKEDELIPEEENIASEPEENEE